MHTLFPGPHLHARSRVRTAARILLEVGGGKAFPTPGHLAAYAGLAPVTRRSTPPSAGNTPTAAATRTSKTPSGNPPSPPCTTRPAAPTTTTNKPKARNTGAAIFCLARRHCDVLHAMLRNGTLYQAPTPAAA